MHEPNWAGGGGQGPGLRDNKKGWTTQWANVLMADTGLYSVRTFSPRPRHTRHYDGFLKGQGPGSKYQIPRLIFQNIKITRWVYCMH
jgi:hypothetical protein